MQLHGKNIKLFTVDSHIEFRREYTVSQSEIIYCTTDNKNSRN